MKKTFYVYILANGKNGTIYTGVTKDIMRRVSEHKSGTGKSFTKRYKIDKLVYYEATEYILNAIDREKQIKGWLRKKKIELIESMNPEWNDLIEDWDKENSKAVSSDASPDKSKQMLPEKRGDKRV